MPLITCLTERQIIYLTCLRIGGIDCSIVEALKECVARNISPCDGSETDTLRAKCAQCYQGGEGCCIAHIKDKYRLKWWGCNLSDELRKLLECR